MKDEKQVYAEDTIINLSTEVVGKKVYLQNETGDMSMNASIKPRREILPFFICSSTYIYAVPLVVQTIAGITHFEKDWQSEVRMDTN